MSKPNIVRLFIGSLLALFGGLILGVAAMISAYAGGALIMNGSDVTGVQNTTFAWTMVGVAVLGGVAMLAGAFGQFIAWIGAVINTSQLQDKTWFLVLLILGLLSFGFIATLAYVVAGPDGSAVASRAPSPTGGMAPTA